jgi:FkbM family methyltransferase
LVRLLDRPGGRLLLGKIATRVVSSVDDLEIAYLNGLWTHRAGRYFFPDSPRFEYTYDDFGKWKDTAEQYLAGANDYWFQYYQPREEDVIVDVGAGRGEDTLSFSKAVGQKGRVIAIEAHPLSFAILRSFCVLNGLANVTSLHFALMDKPGTVRIAESTSSWMENAVEYGNGPSTAEVPAGTLKEVCEQQGVEDIAFLKMNIEGAERFALRGMTSVMPRIRQICVACHDFRCELGHGEQFRTRAFVESFLVGHGFTLASRRYDPRDYVRDHIFGIAPRH